MEDKNGMIAPWEEAETCAAEKNRLASRARREKAERYKRRLVQLSKVPGYPQSAYFDRKKKRYIRLYRGKRSAYLKKRASRVFRRYQQEMPSGSSGENRV